MSSHLHCLTVFGGVALLGRGCVPHDVRSADEEVFGSEFDPPRAGKGFFFPLLSLESAFRETTEAAGDTFRSRLHSPRPSSWEDPLAVEGCLVDAAAVVVRPPQGHTPDAKVRFPP